MAKTIGFNATNGPRGSDIAMTFNKATMIAHEDVTLDAYYSDPTNWKRVLVYYKSDTNTQTNVAIFTDFTGTDPETTMSPTTKSVGDFDVTKVIIEDFDRGAFVLTTSQLVTSEFGFNFESPTVELFAVSGTDVAASANLAGTYRLADNFTAGDWTINQVVVSMDGVTGGGASSGDIRFALYTDTAGEPDAFITYFDETLSVADIEALAPDDNPADFTFTLSSPYVTSNGVDYWLMIVPQGNYVQGGGSNGVHWAGTGSNTGVRSTDSGSTWSASRGRDMSIQGYVN